MLTIALDATYAADPRPTGTGIYSRRLIGAMARDVEKRCRLLLCFRIGPYFRWARKQQWPAGCTISAFWEPWLRPRRADVFHGLNQRLAESSCRARVVTIHDLFPLTSASYSTPEFQARFTAILLKSISAADRIIAVSDATRRELLAHTGAEGRRICVVPHGVDPARPVSPQDRNEFRSRVLRIEKGERFFLNVGTIQTRKNIANIVLALRAAPEVRLVLAGGDGFGVESILALIEKEGFASRIIRLGHASPETLRLLYSTAIALVFPSLEEGFGIPILEAMSYGLPVITSNCSAMPEVGGDAALYVNPLDVGQISEAMRRVAQDDDLAAELSRKGRERAGLFSWERCARETFQVYREALGE